MWVGGRAQTDSEASKTDMVRFGKRLSWWPSHKHHIIIHSVGIFSMGQCVWGSIKKNSYFNLLREEERAESGRGEQVLGIFRIQSVLYVNAEATTQGGRKKGEWIISQSACYKAQAGWYSNNNAGDVPTIGQGDDAEKIWFKTNFDPSVVVRVCGSVELHALTLAFKDTAQCQTEKKNQSTKNMAHNNSEHLGWLN